MPVVISTLTDTINIPPVTWRDGSLTQRLADLIRSGGSSSNGSVFTSGIVRGFEVYPTAANNTVDLLVNQTSGDSMVLITKSDGSSTPQYRGFTALTVDMGAATGLRFLALRPDFDLSILQLVVYSQAEFIAGTITTDESVLIAVIQSVISITQKDIAYFGTVVDSGTNYAFGRNQIYNEELVEQVVVDFGLASAPNVTVSGGGVNVSVGTVGTSSTLNIQNSSGFTRTVTFPFYQYMDPDSRDGTFPNTANRIRAIIDAVNPNDVQFRFLLNDGADTDSLSFPMGSVIPAAASGFVAIEAVPALSTQVWGILVVELDAGGSIGIRNITLEVDRFRAWQIGGTKSQNIVPRAIQFSTSSTNFVNIGENGLRLSDGTTTSVVSVDSWSLETSTKIATITDEGFVYENIPGSLTVTVGEFNPGSGALVGAYFEEAGNVHATYFDAVGLAAWLSTWVEISSGQGVGIDSSKIRIIDATPITIDTIVEAGVLTLQDTSTFASVVKSEIGKYTLSGAQFGFLYGAQDVQANRFQTEYVSNTTGWRSTWRDDTDNQQVQITAEGILVTSTTPTVGITGMTAYGVFGPNVPIGMATASWDGVSAWVLNNSYGVIVSINTISSSVLEFIFSSATSIKGMVSSASGKSGFFVGGILPTPSGLTSLTKIEVETSIAADAASFVTIVVY